MRWTILHTHPSYRMHNYLSRQKIALLLGIVLIRFNLLTMGCRTLDIRNLIQYHVVWMDTLPPQCRRVNCLPQVHQAKLLPQRCRRVYRPQRGRQRGPRAGGPPQQHQYLQLAGLLE